VKKGSKAYGILSVWRKLYDVEYLFTVDENVFIPPKVKSGVMRMRRKQIIVCLAAKNCSIQ
jgi:16S rRNA (adenine1518-N6/adenine1519-N6)-dimethyltransferase